jgi:hypothetical protein
MAAGGLRIERLPVLRTERHKPSKTTHADRRKRRMKKHLTAGEKKFIDHKHALEKKLYDLMLQDRIDEARHLYVLEVKTEIKIWQKIQRVYPEIPYLKAVYHREDIAKGVKSIIKWFFNSIYAPKSQKRPIRIRKVENFYRVSEPDSAME